MIAVTQIPPKVEHTKIVANIKDIYLKTKIEILLNNWCVQKTNNEYIFYKHFNSNRKGVINQLILSGNNYDGIYEFEIFGHDLKFQNYYDHTINNMIIKIESLSNYDLATFIKKNTNVIIDRKEKNNDNIFWDEINKNILKLLSYDSVVIETSNNIFELNHQQLGEIKFKRKILTILKNYKPDINLIKFKQKKKQFYISRMDLGEEDFKAELFKRQLISPQEYDLFTKQDKQVCSELYKNMKKIEIV